MLIQASECFLSVAQWAARLGSAMSKSQTQSLESVPTTESVSESESACDSQGHNLAWSGWGQRDVVAGLKTEWWEFYVFEDSAADAAETSGTLAMTDTSAVVKELSKTRHKVWTGRIKVHVDQRPRKKQKREFKSLKAAPTTKFIIDLVDVD